MRSEMDRLVEAIGIIAALLEEANTLSAENKALKELNEKYRNWLPASYYICNEDNNENS